MKDIEYLDIGGIPHKSEDGQLYKLVDEEHEAYEDICQRNEKMSKDEHKCLLQAMDDYEERLKAYQDLSYFGRLFRTEPRPLAHFEYLVRGHGCMPQLPTKKIWQKVEE